MRSLPYLYILAILAILNACNPVPSEDAFVRVEGTEFRLDGEPYLFVGTNFWYGAYLGSPGPEGDIERLRNELDLLKSIGITNLRVLAASEKASHSRALKPSFQEAPGVVNEDLLEGLDVLLAEMGKRDMKAVVFLNNMWEWSGGMSVYAEWFGEGKTFDPNENGDWHGFQNLSARFYHSQEAQKAWREYIRTVITRQNSVTGIPLYQDPTIMSWQLANEPRPGSGDEGLANGDQFVKWVEESAAYIKSLAPKQLVSTGNEGLAGSVQSEEIYLDAHDSPFVDYLTFHMWAKNWGWIDCTNMEETFDKTLANAEDYVTTHLRYALELGKPTVLSEFGFDRDDCRFDIGSPVTYRDRYLREVFAMLERDMEMGGPAAGTNFWSWGGLGEPQQKDNRWRPGDPFVGDPPQEPQGLNSVFASDSSTIDIIRTHARRIGVLPMDAGADESVGAIGNAPAEGTSTREEDGANKMKSETINQRSQPMNESELTMDIYNKENLIAWCIVPYDKLERTPAERAAMLAELGFERMAWDWRERHLDQLEDEISELRKAGIELSSVWFWLDNRAADELPEHHEQILGALARADAKTTLWVSYDNEFYAGLSQKERLRKAVKSIGNILDRARAQGLTVALYNHGDWFGEPLNQIRILHELGVGLEGSDEIGLVYNFHHGHEQTERFPQLLDEMLPYLWTVNINGMKRGGEKILDVGKGNLEQEMLAALVASGYNGTIGILGHTEGEDVKAVLKRNLEGLNHWVLKKRSNI